MSALRWIAGAAVVLAAVAVGVLVVATGGAPRHPAPDRGFPTTTTAAAPPRVSPPAGLPPLRCPHPTVVVHDGGQLQASLSAAAPGAVIRMAPGVYRGGFDATGSGTHRRPIWLCGGPRAIIDVLGAGPTTSSAAGTYGLHLDGARWWRLVGFAVRNAAKGVVLDGSDHDVLYRITVYDIGDEAIHLRRFSSWDVVEGCVVRDTGLLDPTYGEGVYVGTAHSNWASDTDGRADASDRDSVRWCDIARTTAESVDIKEGTADGVVADNRFDGTGMAASAATSWVNVKGSDYLIEDNAGAVSPEDGFSAHQVAAGTGTGNEFVDNRVMGAVPGYGVFVDAPETVVACSTGGAGAKGLSNQPCVEAPPSR